MSNQKSFYGATKRLYHSPTPDSKSLNRITNGYRLAALQWRSQLSPSSRQGQSQPSASSQPQGKMIHHLQISIVTSIRNVVDDIAPSSRMNSVLSGSR